MLGITRDLPRLGQGQYTIFLLFWLWSILLSSKRNNTLIGQFVKENNYKRLRSVKNIKLSFSKIVRGISRLFPVPSGGSRGGARSRLIFRPKSPPPPLSQGLDDRPSTPSVSECLDPPLIPSNFPRPPPPSLTLSIPAMQQAKESQLFQNLNLICTYGSAFDEFLE